jgi:predicted PurR-regulated permease PerM
LDEASARRLVLWSLAMAVLAVIVVWAAYQVRHVLLLIYVSALFAIGFHPIVRILERQRLLKERGRVPRWLAILLLYVAILGTLTGIGMLIVPALVEQARALWNAAPGMFEKVQSYLIQIGVLGERVTLREAVERAEGAATGDAVGTVMTAVVGVFGGIFGILTVLILTFYFLLEAESLRGVFLHLFPRARRRQISAASGEVTTKISAWLNGQLLLGATIGTSAAIGLWLLGVPYFYVLALIAGIGEMIPIVGPLLAAIPGIAVALSISPQKALLVAIFYLLQQQFENHVLVPKIMERQVGVSAVTVIVALLIGGELLGIVGAILAVPTAAILQVIYQEAIGRDE